MGFEKVVFNGSKLGVLLHEEMQGAWEAYGLRREISSYMWTHLLHGLQAVACQRNLLHHPIQLESEQIHRRVLSFREERSMLLH